VDGAPSRDALTGPRETYPRHSTTFSVAWNQIHFGDNETLFVGDFPEDCLPVISLSSHHCSSLGPGTTWITREERGIPLRDEKKGALIHYFETA
jgi:hypothetical protein